MGKVTQVGTEFFSVPHPRWVVLSRCLLLTSSSRDAVVASVQMALGSLPQGLESSLGEASKMGADKGRLQGPAAPWTGLCGQCTGQELPGRAAPWARRQPSEPIT